MRRGANEMAGPLSLVYIAGNMTDAQKAERTLSEQSIDYAVSLEPFMKSSPIGTVLGSTYTGAFFFVTETQHEFCQNLLRAQGFTDIISLDTSREATNGA